MATRAARWAPPCPHGAGPAPPPSPSSRASGRAHDLEADLGADPSTLLYYLRHLAGSDAGARPLFVVDQFEELFTLCRAEAERQAFIDNLVLAALAPAENY